MSTGEVLNLPGNIGEGKDESLLFSALSNSNDAAKLVWRGIYNNLLLGSFLANKIEINK